MGETTIEVLGEQVKSLTRRVDDCKKSREIRGERLGNLERDVSEVKTDIEHINQQISSLADEINDVRDLTLTVHELATSLKGVKEDVKEVKEAIKHTSSRSQMWLDKIVWAILGGGIAALVTFWHQKCSKKTLTLGYGLWCDPKKLDLIVW